MLKRIFLLWITLAGIFGFALGGSYVWLLMLLVLGLGRRLRRNDLSSTGH